MRGWLWCLPLVWACSSKPSPVALPDLGAAARVDTGSSAQYITRSIADAAPFAGSDIDLTPMIDPEYDPATQQVTWLDNATHEVWVAGMSAITGAFIPPNGKGTLLSDRQIPLGIINNGTEWVNAADGPHVLYTEQDENGDYYMSHAWRAQGGAWTHDRLPDGYNKIAGTGSMNVGDPNGRFVYKDIATDTMRWRNLDNTQGGVLGDWNYFSGPRFVLDTDLVIWNKTIDGVSHLVQYNLANNTQVQLTFGPNRRGDGTMWAAPELGGELVLLALRFENGDPTAVEVYRQLAGEHGPWTMIHEIVGSPTFPYILSPDVLVTPTGSYITLTGADAAALGDITSSHIYLVSALPSGAVFRQLSDNPVAERIDPEPVAYTNSSFVYYSRRPANGRQQIHRVTTGL